MRPGSPARSLSRGEKRLLPIYARMAFCVAVVAALMLLSAGFGSRLGIWGFRTGFTILRYGAYAGAAASVAAVAAVIVSLRRRRFAGALLGFLALAMGSAAVAVPVSWQLDARRVPRIHDITTDVDNPPQFVAILPLRRNATNPATYGGTEVAIKQRQAYPDVKTLILPFPEKEAFARALETARSMGWRIIADDPAQGRVEATDTTFWFGFTDDIVVRITAAGERSLVDVRSVSRVGISDVGTNARRIRAYLHKLEGSG